MWFQICQLTKDFFDVIVLLCFSLFLSEYRLQCLKKFRNILCTEFRNMSLSMLHIFCTNQSVCCSRNQTVIYASCSLLSTFLYIPNNVLTWQLFGKFLQTWHIFRCTVRGRMVGPSWLRTGRSEMRRLLSLLEPLMWEQLHSDFKIKIILSCIRLHSSAPRHCWLGDRKGIRPIRNCATYSVLFHND